MGKNSKENILCALATAGAITGAYFLGDMLRGDPPQKPRIHHEEPSSLEQKLTVRTFNPTSHQREILGYKDQDPYSDLSFIEISIPSTTFYMTGDALYTLAFAAHIRNGTAQRQIRFEGEQPMIVLVPGDPHELDPSDIIYELTHASLQLYGEGEKDNSIPDSHSTELEKYISDDLAREHIERVFEKHKEDYPMEITSTPIIITPPLDISPDETRLPLRNPYH